MVQSDDEIQNQDEAISSQDKLDGQDDTSDGSKGNSSKDFSPKKPAKKQALQKKHSSHRTSGSGKIASTHSRSTSRSVSARHQETKSTHKSENVRQWLFAILGVVLLINVILLFNILSELRDNEREIMEAARLPLVQVTTLLDTSCTNCYDSSQVVTAIKRSNVNVTSEAVHNYNSAEGKALIAKYNIKKVPAVIVTGETENLTLQGFTKIQDALMPGATLLPFTDVETGKIKGLVDTVYLKPECEKCQDLNILVSQFEQSGIRIASKKVLATTSAEALALIAKYNITKAPTLIFSKDIDEYEQVRQAWSSVGTIEADGSYIIRTAQVLGIPYYDLQKNEIRGITDATFIVDKSCEKCYDVAIHKQILDKFGVKFGVEKTVDVSDSDGKQLIAKYNITKVPTFVLSDDASEYASLLQVWPTVGSVEKDGSFIFRNPQVMSGSIYKDLSTGQIAGQPQPAEGNVQIS